MDSVLDVAAFVFKNGAIAEELLFGDDLYRLDLTEAQLAALDGVQAHLEATWVGLLTACRARFWELSEGHACASTVRTARKRPATIWREKAVGWPLVARAGWEATCGVSLQVWGGTDHYGLYAWCWTQRKHVAAVSDAVEQLAGVKGHDARHWIDLGIPEEGQTFDAIADRAASELWRLSRTTADTILSGSPP